MYAALFNMFILYVDDKAAFGNSDIELYMEQIKGYIDSTDHLISYMPPKVPGKFPDY